MMFIKANKIFYHQNRIKAYLNNGLVRPVSVKMRLTDKCNLNCYYCSYKGNLNVGDISYSNATIILRKLSEMGVKGIVFTGGEPTIYPQFEQFVKMAKELYGFDLALITNGIVYANVAKYMTWIRFSLDTLNKEEFVASRGLDVLDNITETISKTIVDKRNQGLKTTIGIQAIVNKYNFDYQFKSIKELIRYAISIEADYVQIRPLENYKYTKEELIIIKDNIEDLENHHNPKIKILTTRYKWHEIENGYRKDYAGCPAANFMGSIDVKGNFYICCAMINDETAKYGNLINENTENILKNREKIQREFDYKKCTVACQGSLLNQTLYDFKNMQHINFI